MKACDDVDWNPSGYAAISGPLLQQWQRLDAIFLHWGESFAAVEHRFPNLISLADLKPVAYLQSFPQLASFACTLKQSDDDLRRFARKNAQAETLEVDQNWNHSQQILTPAACYHFYPRLAGAKLQSDRYLTTVCQCHRREREYLPLQRQWCFNMRELVCIGEPATVENFIAECAHRIERLVQLLGLETRWQIATDPFFDPDHDPKALAQQVDPVKRELTLGDGLAIASINRHRSFFGECYDIRRGGESAHSACVAFGLERWIYALIQRFGPDYASWPDLRGLPQ